MKSKIVYVVKFDHSAAISGVYDTASKAIDWSCSMVHLMDGFVALSRVQYLKAMVAANVIRLGVKVPLTITRAVVQ